MKKIIKKRFIAGAVCPHCDTIDSIAILSVSNKADSIVCMQCKKRFTLQSETLASLRQGENLIGHYKIET